VFDGSKYQLSSDLHREVMDLLETQGRLLLESGDDASRKFQGSYMRRFVVLFDGFDENSDSFCDLLKDLITTRKPADFKVIVACASPPVSPKFPKVSQPQHIIIFDLLTIYILCYTHSGR
jgi:hypothetical protein